jgi:hypothetical protein
LVGALSDQRNGACRHTACIGTTVTTGYQVDLEHKRCGGVVRVPLPQSTRRRARAEQAPRARHASAGVARRCKWLRRPLRAACAGAVGLMGWATLTGAYTRKRGARQRQPGQPTSARPRRAVAMQLKRRTMGSGVRRDCGYCLRPRTTVIRRTRTICHRSASESHGTRSETARPKQLTFGPATSPRPCAPTPAHNTAGLVVEELHAAYGRNGDKCTPSHCDGQRSA